MPALADAFADTDNLVRSYRDSARSGIDKAARGVESGLGLMVAASGRGRSSSSGNQGGGAEPPGRPGGSNGTGGTATDSVYRQSQATLDGGYADIALHQEQFRYFRDWVWCAIRPVAVRIARQPMKVGREERKAAAPNSGSSGKPTGPGGLVSAGNAAGCNNWHQQLAIKSAPTFIQKSQVVLGSLRDGRFEVIDNHQLLADIEEPNDVLTSWALKYFTAISLQLTGKGFWWLTMSKDGRRQFWPLPASWVRPNHSEGLFGGWWVQPPTLSQAIPVAGPDMCYFSYPHPADPLAAYSPLQAIARAVSTDEQIQNSQLQSYKNGIRPGVILKAGRKPSLPGFPQGDRVTFTPVQRRQLIDAIKWAYQGWERHGEPAIVDGLVEEIVPWTNTPREMDYVQSGREVADRVWLGFGVNPISAGKREGANRASAYVADDHLVSNVVNPTIELISQVATRRIGPLYARPGEKLYVWIEEAKPHDADLDLARMGSGAQHGVVTVNEYREFLGLPPRADGEGYVKGGAGGASGGAAGMGGGAGGTKPASAADSEPGQPEGGRRAGVGAGAAAGAAAAAAG